MIGYSGRQRADLQLARSKKRPCQSPEAPRPWLTLRTAPGPEPQHLPRFTGGIKQSERIEGLDRRFSDSSVPGNVPAAGGPETGQNEGNQHQGESAGRNWGRKAHFLGARAFTLLDRICNENRIGTALISGSRLFDPLAVTGSPTDFSPVPLCPSTSVRPADVDESRSIWAIDK